MVRNRSGFPTLERLGLPDYKALPIMGPVIALVIGYLFFAFAYFPIPVNIARPLFLRFCNYLSH
ncbi:hypothetical protein V0R50_17115 [Pseudomonas sp. 148P]|uniref:Uncharacterized protein n=1 Tax=Pseudomonas ulcerans TaxID=3115852 RepID=A0ABU7HTU2_9PSED|nr:MULTISPECIES: hypothetical protein [unclassified Pseudomonas]MEE1923876.1 hypothetical protein [Pseudomonas sp. 147P]MEE1934954.1 hypothetical protein [Pseudomonas sp. 148P]